MIRLTGGKVGGHVFEAFVFPTDWLYFLQLLVFQLPGTCSVRCASFSALPKLEKSPSTGFSPLLEVMRRIISDNVVLCFDLLPYSGRSRQVLRMFGTESTQSFDPCSLQDVKKGYT